MRPTSTPLLGTFSPMLLVVGVCNVSSMVGRTGGNNCLLENRTCVDYMSQHHKAADHDRVSTVADTLSIDPVDPSIADSSWLVSMSEKMGRASANKASQHLPTHWANEMYFIDRYIDHTFTHARWVYAVLRGESV
jgi:hypothetical protein